ncbi:MAG: Flp family type IVb pilin [Pseudomonadota bacterium]
MLSRMKTFLADERGATAIEYAIIVLLIAVASVYGFTLIGVSVKDVFDLVVAGFG